MFSIASGALLDGRHRIVAKVDALMALCDQLEDSLTTATTTRSRLLEALLHKALGSAGGERAARYLGHCGLRQAGAEACPGPSWGSENMQIKNLKKASLRI